MVDIIDILSIKLCPQAMSNNLCRHIIANKSILKITLKDFFSSFQYNSWLKRVLFLRFRIYKGSRVHGFGLYFF